MKKCGIKATITLRLLFLMHTMYLTGAAAQVDDFRVLGIHSGWLMVSSRLYVTIDEGVHWTDITPPIKRDQKIGPVFFLDEKHGWVAICVNHSPEDDETVVISVARTNDGGKSWREQSISPKEYEGGRQFPNPSQIQFIDEKTGWMNVSLAYKATMNTCTGILLRTTDGGRIWKQIGYDSCGRMHFIDREQGWMENHIGDIALLRTHDGGNKWSKISLPDWGKCKNCWESWIDTPYFADQKNGAVMVGLVDNSENSLNHQYSLIYATNDQGDSWQIADVTELGNDISTNTMLPFKRDQPFKSVVCNSTNCYVHTTSSQDQSIVPPFSMPPHRTSISALDDAHWWARFKFKIEDHLFSTTDGGKSFHEIPLPTKLAVNQ